MHKNQILSFAACCIRLKFSAPGELKDYQEAKPESLTVIVTWHYNLITCIYVVSVYSIVIGRLRLVRMENAWGWLCVAALAGACSRDRALRMDCVKGTQINRSSRPQHIYLRSTRHPDLEMKNGGVLMILRGGTGWRHWSLPDLKEYKNAYWKLHILRETWEAQERLDCWCYLSSMSLQQYFDTSVVMPGCWSGHHKHAAAHEFETENMNQWKCFFFHFVFIEKSPFPIVRSWLLPWLYVAWIFPALDKILWQYSCICRLHANCQFRAGNIFS